MNDTLLKPMLGDYTEDTKPGWKYIDRGHHVFANPRFGQLEVGVVRGASYDQPLIHENRGGGSLVIGYTRVIDEVDWSSITSTFGVMMLRAPRFNLVGDEDDWELPGGFVEDGETKLAGGVRELLEETGQLANPRPLTGRGFVGNRAFFYLQGEHEGTSVFAFELMPEQLQAVHASDNLQIMHWKEAVRATRDALTGMAIARFVAEML